MCKKYIELTALERFGLFPQQKFPLVTLALWKLKFGCPLLFHPLCYKDSIAWINNNCFLGLEPETMQEVPLLLSKVRVRKSQRCELPVSRFSVYKLCGCRRLFFVYPLCYVGLCSAYAVHENINCFCRSAFGIKSQQHVKLGLNDSLKGVIIVFVCFYPLCYDLWCYVAFRTEK